MVMPLTLAHSGDWGSAVGSQSFSAARLCSTFAESVCILICIIARSKAAATTCSILQPANQQFAFVDDLARQMIVELDEKFLVADDLSLPRAAVHSLKLFELFFAE